MNRQELQGKSADASISCGYASPFDRNLSDLDGLSFVSIRKPGTEKKSLCLLLSHWNSWIAAGVLGPL